MNSLLNHQKSTDATTFQHPSANHACCTGDAIPFIADRQFWLDLPGFVRGLKSDGYRP